MHFLRFSFRQAFQGLWRNSVMTFAATFTMILMLICDFMTSVTITREKEFGIIPKPQRGDRTSHSVNVHVNMNDFCGTSDCSKFMHGLDGICSEK